MIKGFGLRLLKTFTTFSFNRMTFVDFNRFLKTFVEFVNLFTTFMKFNLNRLLYTLIVINK